MYTLQNNLQKKFYSRLTFKVVLEKYYQYCLKNNRNITRSHFENNED